MKRACFIIPYFGKLPNYFQLFLNSCAPNKKFDWLIITNDNREFSYPKNVKKIFMEWNDFKRFAQKKFKEKFGVIPNVSDKDFFTNSIHVPVWKKMSPFEKIDIESQLTGYSSAGCITYIELEGGIKNNLEALETIVNYAMDHDIPYFAVNVPNDTCLNCGYCDDFNDRCPKCGSTNIQQLRRVTRCLTGKYKTAFNKGKQQEVEMRVKHESKVEV